jgi:predicted enzyme related to lactoylglutathione lyase
MGYRVGNFVWFELVTPSVADGAAFWMEVAGFGTTDRDMGATRYKVLTSEGKSQAGVVEPQMAGVPPHWHSYLSVDDVDRKAAAVAANGGKVLVPAMDIPNVGRFAVVADPEGAVFSLFRGATGDDDAPTRFRWNELWAKNAEAVLPFYQQVFGFGHQVSKMGTATYHLLTVGDVSVAGLMTSPDAKVPPMWLPYVAIDDVDAAVARARTNRGAVHAEPMTVANVGRFGIVADRQGAVLGVITAARPTS